MVRLARPLIGRKVPKDLALILPRLPRFTKEEEIVAREFIKQMNWDGEYWFDVHIPSEKAKWVVNAPPNFKYMWEMQTAKRIDMVILTDRDVKIVEVKRLMLSSGIGQLLLYKDMFREYYKPDKSIELWYAVYYWDPDVAKKCEREGIKWWSYIK